MNKRMNRLKQGVTLTAVAILTVSTVVLCFGKAAPPADKRVDDALKKLNLKAVKTKLGNYRVEFEISGPEKRSHLVFVASNTETYRGFEIRKVWAVAYKTSKDLSAGNANLFLRMNVIEKMGAWEFSRREDGNRLKYVVRVPADASPQVLDAALHSCLFTADAMEKKLTNKDEF